jgi:hypothetical protein
MDRHLIAYLILVVLAVAMSGAVAWRLYHSRDRVIERRRSRERAFRELTQAGRK